MPRPQMMTSAAALVPPGETVHEIVLVQERPRWVVPLAVIAGAALFAAIGADRSTPAIAGAIAGGAIGLIYAWATKFLLLAKTSERVLLMRSSKWRASAVAIEEEIPSGTNLHRVRGWINEVYQLGNRTLIVSRAFKSRLESILAVE